MSKFHPAYLNGHKVSAVREHGQWLVGGDKVQPGQDIAIMLASKWHDGRPSWFVLKGCRLVFSDFAGHHDMKIPSRDEWLG